MAEACRALDFPIVSGNVSLYNETKNEDGSSLAILPTPAIGGVGLLEDWEKSATIAFKAEGDAIFLIGGDYEGSHLGRSLWLEVCHRRQDGPPPSSRLVMERAAGENVRRLIDDGWVSAVHDVSDGGLLVAIAEMALAGGIGAVVYDRAKRFPEGNLKASNLDPRYGARLAQLMFGEDQSRYVVTIPQNKVPDFVGMTTHDHVLGFMSQQIGLVGGDAVQIGQFQFNRPPLVSSSVPLADLRAAHESFFPKLMGSELTPEF
jgi:phosphoribosylformylglycinamidine synthase